MAGFVQAVGVDSSSFPTNCVSRSITPTTGNTIVVFADLTSATSDVVATGTLTVTDSFGNTYTEATGAMAAVLGAVGTPSRAYRTFYSIGITGGTGTVTVNWGVGWSGGPSYGCAITTVELNGVASLNDSKGVTSTLAVGVSTTVGTGTAKFNVHINGGGSAGVNLFVSLLSFNASSANVPGILAGFQEAPGGSSSFVNLFQPPLNGVGADANLGISTGFVYNYVKFAFPVAYRLVFPLANGTIGNSADGWVFLT
jgi:hypothetical protein